MQHRRQTPAKALSWIRHFRQKRYHWYAAAAVLLIYIPSSACLLMAPEMTASYQTDHDHHKTVTLRDGSELILAPASGVSVVMDETGRRVELRQGSARFAVSQDPERPFDVIAANGRIRVVGTIFNVSLSKQVTVSVSRGAVDVFVDEAVAPVRLTYGYSVAYDTGGITIAGIRHQLDDWHRVGNSRTDLRHIMPSGLLISWAGGHHDCAKQPARRGENSPPANPPPAPWPVICHGSNRRTPATAHYLTDDQRVRHTASYRPEPDRRVFSLVTVTLISPFWSDRDVHHSTCWFATRINL